MRYSPIRRTGAAAFVLLLAGCATTSAARDPRDPFEPLNRATFAFNDALDRVAVRPVVRGYRRVAPQSVETGVSNFFANSKIPVTLFNDALQGKFRAAIVDGSRFLLNTTLGIGGLFDPASAAGLDRNDEDFGQTLGHWGVSTGPYLMVPLLGPYTLRDGLGTLADDFAHPRQYLGDASTRYALWAAEKLDRRARLLDADVVLQRTGDKYVFVRSAYLQRREYQTLDGNVPIEAPPEEDSGPVPPAPAAADAKPAS